ncbi:MAG: acyl carrier protein [Candidatus Improbicoccus devescovinae]|nr:MAG: acyl carrier protein [Candidatus Improbicoccus devescovinae]
MVFEKVKTLLCEQFNVEDDEINLQTSLQDLGADSLDVADFVSSVQAEFDITLEPDAVDIAQPLDGLVKYIERLLVNL